MRKLSGTVKTLLDQSMISVFYLIKMEFRPDAVTTVAIARYTDLGQSITIPGDGTYEPTELLSVDPPKISDTLDRSIYKIIFIDPQLTRRPLFESNLNGTKISVKIGFFNNTENTIDGVLPGQPFTDPDDITVVYAGFVDTCSYNVDANEGIVTATIECNNPMNTLNLTRALYTSREEIRAINATDSSFDLCYTGSQKFSLRWGQESPAERAAKLAALKKKKKKKKKCFITTAVCEYSGKSDDCIELTTLRLFRDNWVLDHYPESVKEYYQKAPLIVNRISEKDNRKEIFKEMERYIQQSILAISSGDYELAYEIYKDLFKYAESVAFNH